MPDKVIVLKGRDTDRCKYEGCDKRAETLACGRGKHPTTQMYCYEHARDVSYEGYPEYVVTCPNCDCDFGVN